MAPTSQPLELVPNIKPDATATAVFAEQVRLLYRLSLSTYGGTLAVALIVTCGLWNVAPNALLAAWLSRQCRQTRRPAGRLARRSTNRR